MQIAVDLESGELRVIWERYDNSGCMDMRDVLAAYETMFVGMWQYEQTFFPGTNLIPGCASHGRVTGRGGRGVDP